VIIAKRIQFVRGIDIDLCRVVQMSKPPGGHLPDFVERAIAKQADWLRVAEQSILLGPVEFFNVCLEVVFKTREYDHAVRSGIGERDQGVDDLEEPFKPAPTGLAMSSSWSMRSTSGTPWTMSVNIASCCNILIGSASSVRGTASPIQEQSWGRIAWQRSHIRARLRNLGLVPFQVQHHPEQFEVTAPETTGRLQPVSVAVDELGRIAITIAEHLHVGPG